MIPQVDANNYTEEVLDSLTLTFARYCKEVTGLNIVDGDGEVIPKLEGSFLMINVLDTEQRDWEDNEYTLEDGVHFVTHNYTVTFLLTSYRGKPSNALSRIIQSFSLPYLRDKYFPEGSPYAYSSCSSISRIRVPLNVQTYENRATVMVTFNVCVGMVDSGVFEEVENVNIDYNLQSYSNGPFVDT